MKQIFQWIVLILASGSLFLNGEEKQIPVPKMNLVKCGKAPVIDGKLEDPAWKNASKTASFLLFNTPRQPLFRTDGMATYDDENLYVAFRAADRDIQKWYAPSGREFDGEVWMDDCVELYVANPLAPKEIIQFVVNYDGIGFDQASASGKVAWNGIWKFAVQRDQNGYTAEFAIPFYTLNITPSMNSFRMNLCREKYVLPSELSSWSCAYGDFHFTERFGEVHGLQLTPWKFLLADVTYPKTPVFGKNGPSGIFVGKTFRTSI